MADPIKKEDKAYTYGEYRTWPAEERWELIDGVAYDMSPGAWPSSPDHFRVVGRPGPAPKRIHQEILMALAKRIAIFLENKPCKVYPAPFDVLLPALGEEADDDVTTVVQPDISVICDKSKLTESGCTGAPDWIIDPGNEYIHIYLLQDDGEFPEEPLIRIRRDGNAASTVLPGFTVELNELFHFE